MISGVAFGKNTLHASLPAVFIVFAWLYEIRTAARISGRLAADLAVIADAAELAVRVSGRNIVAVVVSMPVLRVITFCTSHLLFLYFRGHDRSGRLPCLHWRMSRADYLLRGSDDNIEIIRSLRR